MCHSEFIELNHGRIVNIPRQDKKLRQIKTIWIILLLFSQLLRFAQWNISQTKYIEALKWLTHYIILYYISFNDIHFKGNLFIYFLVVSNFYSNNLCHIIFYSFLSSSIFLKDYSIFFYLKTNKDFILKVNLRTSRILYVIKIIFLHILVV